MQNKRPILFIRKNQVDKIFRGKSISVGAGVVMRNCVFLDCEIVDNAGRLTECLALGPGQEIAAEFRKAIETAQLAASTIDQIVGAKVK